MLIGDGQCIVGKILCLSEVFKGEDDGFFGCTADCWAGNIRQGVVDSYYDHG